MEVTFLVQIRFERYRLIAFEEGANSYSLSDKEPAIALCASPMRFLVGTYSRSTHASFSTDSFQSQTTSVSLSEC